MLEQFFFLREYVDNYGRPLICIYNPAHTELHNN